MTLWACCLCGDKTFGYLCSNCGEELRYKIGFKDNQWFGDIDVLVIFRIFMEGIGK
ncbi:MAG: hypothetical protein V3U54_13495 [Thermodesulfobacteriota bacterium]